MKASLYIAFGSSRIEQIGAKCSISSKYNAALADPFLYIADGIIKKTYPKKMYRQTKEKEFGRAKKQEGSYR
jgi:hypothetical protein